VPLESALASPIDRIGDARGVIPVEIPPGFYNLPPFSEASVKTNSAQIKIKKKERQRNAQLFYDPCQGSGERGRGEGETSGRKRGANEANW